MNNLDDAVPKEEASQSPLTKGWMRLPTWGKWTAGVVAALILLAIGGAIGSSGEGKLKDEKSELEGQLAHARSEQHAAEGKISAAEAKATRIEGLKGKIVGEAEDKAASIIGSAKSEAEEAEESLGSLQSEVESTQGELESVEGSLGGAEHTKALSSFGEGIMKAEVDFVPGTYEAPGGSGCYWALLNSANTNDMAGNEFAPNASQQIVTITTPYFQSSDCGKWERIGE